MAMMARAAAAEASTPVEAGELTLVHDLSDGGLVGAAADIALASDVGVELNASSQAHAHAFLFGEDQARYLIAAPAAEAETLLEAARAAGIPAALVGRFEGDRVTLGTDSAPLAELSRLYRSAFAAAIHGELPDHA